MIFILFFGIAIHAKEYVPLTPTSQDSLTVTTENIEQEVSQNAQIYIASDVIVYNPEGLLNVELVYIDQPSPEKKKETNKIAASLEKKSIEKPIIILPEIQVSEKFNGDNHSTQSFSNVYGKRMVALLIQPHTQDYSKAIISSFAIIYSFTGKNTILTFNQKQFFLKSTLRKYAFVRPPPMA